MPPAPTANERFKQSSRSSFWISLIVATLVHAAVFAGSPVFALDVDTGAEARDEITVVPPRIATPEPPPPIRPPVAPVISADVPDHVTMEPYGPEDWKTQPLDPPPSDGGGVGETPRITPMDIAPRLLNPAEVQRTLQKHYPPVLRDARIGGVVSVWFHIDEAGRVMETRIDRSSGYDALDRAALAVAGEMEFSPAMNRDRRIPVWVSLEILFEAR